MQQPVGPWYHNVDALDSFYVERRTTGLTAKQLHDMPAEKVATKMKAATKEVLQDREVRAICLGCAGMAGLDKTVREACIDELGEDDGTKIRIVDGVVAGIFLAGEALEKRR